MTFHSIESEVARTYEFPCGASVVIANPARLAVSASGGHRIIDAEGRGHYIPAGWVHLHWTVQPGCPPFCL